MILLFGMEGDFGIFLKDIFKYVGYFLPIFIPIVLIYRIKFWFQMYAEEKATASINFIVFEIRPPEDVFKSPAAFELFLGSLYDTGREQTWIKTELQGKSRPEFSLEIASFGGNIVFYIRCETGMRQRVEAQLHAQYPGIEVKEVEDYMQDIELDFEKQDIWFNEFKLAKSDAYPIRTYIDFGLDKETEDDYKIDPITPVLEFLGSIEPGFFAGYQIIIRAHKFKPMIPPFKDTDTWIEDAKKEIEKIRREAVTEVDVGDRKEVLSNPTKGQQEKIAAIERSISKLAFDTGIRIIYMAPREIFHRNHIGSFLGSFRHFSAPNLNGMKPGRTAGSDYPWWDFFRPGVKIAELKESFKAYKNREYFHNPYKKYRLFGPSSKEMRKPMILTTEEIASLYHFPGRVSQTPITRAESKRGAPPSNLPI